MITQLKLAQHMAGFPETSPRLRALELRIGIGTGFHNKWCRSQKEHMLGWMQFQAYQSGLKGEDHRVAPATPVGNRLKCIPAMFWRAEAAGVPESALIGAEAAADSAAAARPTDGGSHGKIMRQFLPWEIVNDALRRSTRHVSETETADLTQKAYDRLASKRSKYRQIEDRFNEFLRQRTD